MSYKGRNSRNPTRLTFRILAAAFLTYFTIAIGGCKKIECGSYHEYVENDKLAATLLSWADSEVMNRSYAENELRGGSLVGPGRRAIRLAAARIDLPEGLANSEIRVLNQDARGPTAIFIGKRRFQGLIITRDSMPGSLKAIGLTPELLDSINGRLAVMCYQEKENMQPKQ